MESILTPNELDQINRFRQIQLNDENYKSYVLTGINDEDVFFVSVKEQGTINCEYLTEEQYEKMYHAIGLIAGFAPHPLGFGEFIKSVSKMMKLQSDYFRTRDKKILEECKVIEKDVRKQLINLEKI